ncbi:hypothetical protein [Serratia marcescens]|uniref:hypothetical protein n=1 Tax=Serratia marcescens TaxID=615 RepID=UPI0018DA169B|nr:hypothetical protein [Serratia marcescens]MBH2772945.1 hypothetical protein [Serratia marcescens]WGL92747.1 hypothetical protein QFB85_07560 [Serratia marcescens]HAV2278595.1 hypothetical protein [Serratia marcescens]
MCGLCGLLDDAPQWSDPLRHSDLPARQRRLRQLAILNRALAPLRLTLNDVHGNSWLLTSATGQQAVITRLDQLWREAERLSKRPIDPLDERYLAALASAEAP